MLSSTAAPAPTLSLQTLFELFSPNDARCVQRVVKVRDPVVSIFSLPELYISVSF